MKEYIAINPAHAPAYEFYIRNLDSHAEVPARVEEIEKALRVNQVGELVYVEDFKPVPKKLLRSVHYPKYVDFILGRAQEEDQHGAMRYATSFRYPRSTHRSRDPITGHLGSYSADTYTPVHKGLTKAALDAASASYSAALEINSGAQVAYAAARPPGHHAGYDYMGGYCYLNNSMVAAEVLSQTGKVAILDVDFHHGNGTHDIIKMKNEQAKQHKILGVSIHADPDKKFPYFSGKNPGSMRSGLINFPLAEHTGVSQYDPVLHKSIDLIDKFDPSFLIVSLGFDTYMNDTLTGGFFQLNTEYYEQMAHTIMELNRPTLIIQEGGYNVADIGKNALSFIRGVESNLPK